MSYLSTLYRIKMLWIPYLLGFILIMAGMMNEPISIFARIIFVCLGIIIIITMIIISVYD